MNSVRKRIAHGAAWMVAVRLAERGLGFIGTLVLVRLLLPEDFGLLAMAMSIIAILELLSAFSFDVAIIQRSDVSREHLNTAWTLNVILGIGTSLLMMALAGAAADFYREPRLEEVIYVLAVAWLLTSFENIGVVLFRKDLQFRREFLFVFSKRVATFATTIPLAVWLNSYWALVIGMIVGRTVGVLVSYLMHDFRPRFSFAHARELVGFSSWLLANNFFNVMNKRASDFVIGRSIGAGNLGVFRVASDLATLPTTELIAPINRAVFPGLAILKGDVDKLRKTFTDIVALVAFLTIPAGFGIAAVSEPLVLAALGTAWVDAVDVVAVLGFYCAVYSLGTSSSVVFMAAGKVRLLTALSAARVLVLLPALVLVVPDYGVTGAVWAMTGVAALFAPLILMAACHLLELRMAQILGTLWRPTIGAFIMYATVSELLRSNGAPDGTLAAVVYLFGGVIVGMAAYGAITTILWLAASRPAGPETLLLHQAAELAKQRRLRTAAR